MRVDAAQQAHQCHDRHDTGNQPQHGDQSRAQLAQNDLGIRQIGGQHVVEGAPRLVEANGTSRGGRRGQKDQCQFNPHDRHEQVFTITGQCMDRNGLARIGQANGALPDEEHPDENQPHEPGP